MTITGGCRCGAVRYSIEAEPLFARHCWCRDCQYIGAGSGTVNVFFASEKVAIEGALTDYTSRADSGTLMHRQFCVICGTPMFTQADMRKHYIGHPRRNPRRARSRQAANHHLDLERAELGLLRSRPTLRGEASPATTESLTRRMLNVTVVLALA
jgi:hypothetical protein